MGGRFSLAAIYVTLAIAGLAAGIAGAFVQADSGDLGPVPIPYGVLVATGAAAGLFWIARSTAPSSRVGVIVSAAAWLTGVLPFSTNRPEGDVVLPGGDFRSYVYLFVPTLAAAVLATLPAPSKVNLNDVWSGDT